MLEKMINLIELSYISLHKYSNDTHHFNAK
jgi:hypothetical protein